VINLQIAYFGNSAALVRYSSNFLLPVHGEIGAAAASGGRDYGRGGSSTLCPYSAGRYLPSQNGLGNRQFRAEVTMPFPHSQVVHCEHRRAS
jgi:hypothetical protein